MKSTRCGLVSLVIVSCLLLICKMNISDMLQLNKSVTDTSLVRYEYRRFLVNVPFTQSDTKLASTFATLVEKKADQQDPALLDIVREILDPRPKQIPMVRDVTTPETPQGKIVKEILNNKKNGFFIEVGANDGEEASNTLFFERKLNWTGLLIEMDPLLYTQLLGKCRRVYSVNTGLSTSRHPHWARYASSPGGSHTAKNDKRRNLNRFSKQNLKLETIYNASGIDSHFDRIPCIPLASILTVMGIKHVDYFSLDIEGMELDVLKTIPFNIFTFDVLSVEWAHIPEGKEACLQYMSLHGYIAVRDIVYKDVNKKLWIKDYIFVRRELLSTIDFKPI